MSKTNKDQSEITISSDGFSIKGDVLNDFRPLIKRGVDITDSVLRLLASTICLPADYVSTHLERFKSCYKEKFDEIPIELRQEPSLRIGCTVLRHAAFSADESELQELFASLLTSASNKELASEAHPGFATVINDLEPHEALMISLMKDKAHRFSANTSNITAISERVNVSPDKVASGLANLLRLGILEWENNLPSSYSIDELTNSLSGRETLFGGTHDINRAIRSVFRELTRKDMIRISAFGSRFIKTCLPKQ